MQDKSNLRNERGQALILLVLAMTVTFFVGAIAVDIGLWLSERRGAQTDADFIALTGAWALLEPGADEQDAKDAANDALAANDEQLNATIFGEPEVEMDPQGYDSCVSVNVRHDSRPLFFEIFGLGSPNIGAHATACTGAIQAPGNLVPFQIDNNPGPCFDTNEEPMFTSMCPLELGAQGDNPRGMLDLQASGDYCSEAGGSGDIEDLIEFGAPGICLITETNSCDPNKGGPWYDCVAVQTGNPKKVLDGTAARLAKDGGCDGPDAGNIDDFFETIILVFDTGDPFTSIYEPRDCDPATDGKQISSRLVSLIVLEDPPIPGNTGYPSLAFAAFYIAGCAGEGVVVVDESDLDRYCDDDYQVATIADNSYVSAVPPLGPVPGLSACHKPDHNPPGNPCATPGPTPPVTGSPGHAVVYGRFVNIIYAGGAIGDPTDQTTAFGIALVE
ncbi:MAG TPA: Tad domain-containing protein [Dehalococcoidia bacterium]